MRVTRFLFSFHFQVINRRFDITHIYTHTHTDSQSSRNHRSREETLHALNRGYIERLYNGSISFRKCARGRSGKDFQEHDNANEGKLQETKTEERIKKERD